MKRTLTTGTILAIIAVALFIALYPANAKSDSYEPEGPTVAQLQTAHAALLADAIYATEGRCTPGQSGEYGCFQYLPRTWSAYSTTVAGKVLPQTAANERMVTQGMILSWIQKGESDRAILLTWNQGTQGPDCYKGVNDHGVPYNSCDYAVRGLAYLTAHKGQ